MNYQNLKRFKVPPDFRGRSTFIVQLWWLVQASLFAHSPKFLYGWRRFLLRLFGAKVGKGVLIRPSVEITYPWKVSIGNYVWIGDDSVLYSLGDIEIGDHTALAHRVYLCTGTHDYTSSSFDIEAYKITIGAQVWLPNDVFVSPGVSISDGVVVGARSSVFSDLPEGMICVGSPAKPIRKRLEK